ncbi:hypothetical protein GOP47_0026075 [Adiantum capillus-veneris]|uniref:Uncharacterized protein n=1 Tax=Adiantum capillus-veneris TaxID=13818 RepID=A0A9D4Z4R8_ADICA|nr:hypothetical protein GOP47_0026075 [Adiantum capillus-veneris]
MEESLDLMDVTAADDEEDDEEQKKAKAEKDEDEAGNVCAAMASIMSGLSVRVHVAGGIPAAAHGLFNASEKKPVHGQVARLRKEDQQLMEDVCTDACGCGCGFGCFCSISNGICGGSAASGSGSGSTSPCRRRLLHHIVANNQDNCRTPPPPPHFDNMFGHRISSDSDAHHHMSGSSNVSTPRASTPSPLGIRTRSWSTAAADAAWDSAASIARTVSSSF